MTRWCFILAALSAIAAGPLSRPIQPAIMLSSRPGEIAFRPDSTEMAISRPGRITFLTAQSPSKATHYLTLETILPSSLTYSPDGKILVVLEGSGRLSFLNPYTGIEILTTKPIRQGLTSLRQLRFSTDGRLLAATDDNRAVLWMGYRDSKRPNVSSRREHLGRLSQISHDFTYLAQAQFQDVDVYQTHFETSLFSLVDHPGAVVGLCFSPKDTLLAVLTRRADDEGKLSHEVRIWALARRQPHVTILLGEQPCKSLAFSPDEETLAVGSTTARGQPVLRLYDTAGGKERHREEIAEQGTIRSLTYRPDGGMLAACCDNSIRAWRFASPKRQENPTTPPRR